MIGTGRVVGVEITAEDMKPNLEDRVALENIHLLCCRVHEEDLLNSTEGSSRPLSENGSMLFISLGKHVRRMQHMAHVVSYPCIKLHLLPRGIKIKRRACTAKEPIRLCRPGEHEG